VAPPDDLGAVKRERQSSATNQDDPLPALSFSFVDIGELHLDRQDHDDLRSAF
jgi:hypothetical protein